VRLCAAFALGAATVFSFSPFYLFPISVVTLVCLFLLWGHSERRRTAFFIGFAYGLGLFLFGVSWVYVSIHDFGGLPAWLAGLATLGFCCVLAAFPAFAGFLQSYSKGEARYALVMPVCWVATEWARGWVLTGFPWLALGYSQAPNSPLAGYAPVIGVYGVTLAISLSAGFAAQFIVKLNRGSATQCRFVKCIAFSVPVVMIWVVGFGLKQVPWTKPVGEPIKVSLLQGGIAQNLKWKPQSLSMTMDLYASMVSKSDAKLIVLPEIAIPIFYHQIPRDYLDRLKKHAAARAGGILMGVPELEGKDNYFNSVVTLGPDTLQRYRKVHLVPLGEFIPFSSIFGWVNNILQIPLADFSRGEIRQQPINIAGQKIAVNICYEDAFGEEIIRQLPEATMLVNVSNVAWFGRSLAPMQHLQISQMRALETGRTMLRATNTGMTAVINYRGEVEELAPEFTVATITRDVQGREGATPYVRFGNLPVIAFLLVAVVFMFLIGLLRKKTNKRC